MHLIFIKKLKDEVCISNDSIYNDRYKLVKHLSSKVNGFVYKVEDIKQEDYLRKMQVYFIAIDYLNVSVESIYINICI